MTLWAAPLFIWVNYDLFMLVSTLGFHGVGVPIKLS